MANVVRAGQGFRVLWNSGAADFTAAVNMYFQPASDATATAQGDLVKLVATSVAPSTQTTNLYYPVAYLPTVTRITATTDIPVGVVVGFLPDPANLQYANYRLASTDRYVLVADSPLVELENEVNGAYTYNTLVGLNISPKIGAITTVTNVAQSNMEVDGTTAATTSTLMFRVKRYVQRVDNQVDTTSPAAAKVVLQFNAHQYLAGGNTTGI
jgi:hypothetical protein